MLHFTHVLATAAFLGGPSRPALRAPAPAMSAADSGKEFSRAEFWSDDKATLVDLANVMGRWTSGKQWQVRNKFASKDLDTRKEDPAQAGTQKRYEMAQRLNMVERVAMQQNVPRMAFTDERLAASVGKTVAEMEAMPVRTEAINVMFDILMESKSGLLPLDVCDKRRAGVLTAEGGLDEGKMTAAILKARGLVIFSWFFLGKGQILGVAIFFKVINDATGFLDQFGIPYLDWIAFGAALAAALFAGSVAPSSAADSVYTTYTDESIKLDPSVRE